MEKSLDVVAAANFAAADSLPTFPVQVLIKCLSSLLQTHTPVIAIHACWLLVLQLSLWLILDIPHWSRRRGICMISDDPTVLLGMFLCARLFVLRIDECFSVYVVLIEGCSPPAAASSLRPDT